MDLLQLIASWEPGVRTVGRPCHVLKPVQLSLCGGL